MEAVEIITTRKGVLKIYQDQDPMSPREWDNLGTIYHWHRRYELGTRISPDDDLPKGVKIPVYMYDHSGVTISTEAFSCGWDSGQVGWIVAPLERIKDEYKCKKVTPTIRKKVIQVLKGEVDTYARYLEGNVYGFVLEGPPPDPCSECGTQKGPEHLDSCWGFVGFLDDVRGDIFESAGLSKEDVRPTQSIAS
jgi:hypothetical protein